MLSVALINALQICIFFSDCIMLYLKEMVILTYPGDDVSTKTYI